MTEDNFETLLDQITTEKSTVTDICKNYNQQESPPIITDEQIKQHAFFTHYFSRELCKILEIWFNDGSLSEENADIFRACSAFILKLTQTQSYSKEWLSQQTELIDFTEKCLNEIASYGYYIGIGGTEDPNLESFDWLIQAFENAQCRQLLDTLVKCVICRFYVEALYHLSDVDALTLTITQHFLLVTCPDYILTCDKDKSHCLKIVNQMLSHYNDIYAEFLPHINQWTIPVILCLIYPIKFILANIRALTFEQREIIYGIILTIILNKSTIDQNIEQVRVSLIYTSLCILIEIMRSDKNLANRLKNMTNQKEGLIKELDNLSKNEHNTSIQLKAVELKAFLLSEEEFSKDTKTEEVTGLFVNNINNALENGQNEQVDEILSGLKSLVNNEEVKEEIVKQNGLPSILKYAKQTNDNPLPLEITYAMTFNGDAKKVINQDKDFVEHVRKLRESEKADVSKVAHGIMWKLEGEEKFKEKEDEKEKNKKENKSGDDSEAKPSQFDIMISYCWAQKPLCHKVNDRLEKDGYNVWLDRDEMHGSIIERMAEAIENSRFVLICMSSNYKNSVNCKAEAEYAFNRKSKIVPLMVEANYRADGWLGFLAGSKIYVDFADKEDEEFDKAYELLIAELERNGLRDTDEKQESRKTSRAPSIHTPERKKSNDEIKPPTPPPIQTTEYLNVGPASGWNSQHVQEFLVDNKLDQLQHVCEDMDGETLIEFGQSCQTVPDKMYALINNPKDEHPVSFNTFFKFISKLKKHLPPKPQRKVQFQYDFVYPTADKTTGVEKKT
ncbi:unnamed protein product [Adineta steineri]|uniref:TIR domain-containing protein n=2 Tax=Adineta steineri TaxID=433720 RepID=A0A819CH95_9BILA|nr:unnamed protein product [Adineta steineri]CAF3818128.1 unnamed protein product [Adineta steineri]